MEDSFESQERLAVENNNPPHHILGHVRAAMIRPFAWLIEGEAVAFSFLQSERIQSRQIVVARMRIAVHKVIDWIVIDPGHSSPLTHHELRRAELKIL